MPQELILADRIGKKFHRTLTGAVLDKTAAFTRKALRMKLLDSLGKDEFWALREISFMVRRGECLGVIGPNGAGKSTLLRLLNREYQTDAGRLLTLGKAKSLIRIGSGLQALFSGRENIYLQCQQLGLDKTQTDAKLDEIIAFAGLESAIDAPVKTYSDGMYARLEFAIATAVPADILLVDEVLAVGDIAFQIRALDKLNQLKAQGAAIVFVSHSEMNVRHIADQCLLLFDGKQVGLGSPEALFYQYYQSVGYLNDRLQPLQSALTHPPVNSSVLEILGITEPAGSGSAVVSVGDSIKLQVHYQNRQVISGVQMVLQVWNAGEMLVASADSGRAGRLFRLEPGKGEIPIQLPFVSLTAGAYTITAGFVREGEWIAYSAFRFSLMVQDCDLNMFGGIAVLEAKFGED